MAIVSVRHAFHDLIALDATMQDLLGLKQPGFARVRYGWVAAVIEEAAFPAMTYYLTGDDQLGEDGRTGKHYVDGELLATIWVFDGKKARQGIAHAEAIDARLLELCRDKWSVFQGARIHWNVGSVRDYPDEPGAPIRIARPIFAGVN